MRFGALLRAVVVRGTQHRLAALARAKVTGGAFLRRGGLIGTSADRLPGDTSRNASGKGPMLRYRTDLASA